MLHLQHGDCTRSCRRDRFGHINDEHFIDEHVIDLPGNDGRVNDHLDRPGNDFGNDDVDHLHYFDARRNGSSR